MPPAGASRKLERGRRARSRRSRRLSMRTRTAPSASHDWRRRSSKRSMTPACSGSCCRESLNGGALTIPESLRVFEEVARLDASAAWNLAICADGPLFGHFVAREAFEEIFGDPRAVMVGSLNPAGIRAVACDGGWRFSGRAIVSQRLGAGDLGDGVGLVLRDGKPRDRRRRAGSCARGCSRSSSAPPSTPGTSPACAARAVTTHLRGRVRAAKRSRTSGPIRSRPGTSARSAASRSTTQLGGALATVAVGVAQHVLDAFARARDGEGPGGRARDAARAAARADAARAGGRAGCAPPVSTCTRRTTEVWRMGEAGEAFEPRRPRGGAPGVGDGREARARRPSTSCTTPRA